MSDLIDRQAAIDACIRVQEHHAYDEIEEIKALPSAQPEPCEDTISRKAAIDALDKIFPADPMRNDYTQGIACGAALAKTYVEQLPPAQPDKDMIHLQKEQAYMQGWEEGRNALREEIWENERDRLD